MTIDSLFEQLKHPNPNLRERAMYELAEQRDDQTIPRLVSLLDQEDVTYRRAAVKALGFIGSDSVPPLVELLLNSDDAVIRSSCAKALAQVAYNHPEDPFPEVGMQGLKTALNDPNPVVHIASAMALGEIGGPALDILIEALKTTDNEALSIALVNALSSIADERIVVELSALANNESADSYVRESAISALSRLEMILQYSK
ncbi:PBS lyase HEAT domain protein repeat-containing protein (plasmid) [Gloeothece citriformis PCC 7424]|uniref:PBS lyase HEAT domain protein repeat-containing protein n=1 Tax=Gloeothece citriformis (strain PCC 7424) TaxID=65393 RepID=B7KLX3_GLOC7|nr:HEAT repeat domain-containing protein [Gloeothece citriformis]ACK73795.1 PBS lyase HEAT domain protein repeat-containing protein [Gloeothece citriformis PCC 7424]